MSADINEIMTMAIRSGLPVFPGDPPASHTAYVRFYELVRDHLSANTSPSSHAASPVATTADFRMRADMEVAPFGQTLLLINEGGSLMRGPLTQKTLSHFIEWQYVPKRALRK